MEAENSGCYVEKQGNESRGGRWPGQRWTGLGRAAGGQCPLRWCEGREQTGGLRSLQRENWVTGGGTETVGSPAGGLPLGGLGGWLPQRLKFGFLSTHPPEPGRAVHGGRWWQLWRQGRVSSFWGSEIWKAEGWKRRLPWFLLALGLSALNSNGHHNPGCCRICKSGLVYYLPISSCRDRGVEFWGYLWPGTFIVIIFLN